MSTVLDNIDSEYLISAVEERPEIWDASNEYFRNRDLKERAWTEIAAAFIQNCIQFENEDTNTLIPKLQKRWKTVRDAFKRFKARGGVVKPESKKTPKYFENLKFLEKNMDLTTDNSTENFFIETDQTLREVLEQSDIEEEVYHHPVQPKTEILEKKRTSKRILYEENPVKYCLATYDGDKSFLDSLLPTLQTFSEEQKLQFRIEVLNTLQRVKNLFPQQSPPSRGPLKSYVLTPDGELKEEKKRPSTAAERMRKMRERRKATASSQGKNVTPSKTTKTEEITSNSNDTSGANDTQPNVKKMKLEEENADKDTKDRQVDSVILIWTELLGHKLQDFDLLTRECLMNETDNNVFKARIKMMRQKTCRNTEEVNRTSDHPYNMEVRYVDISSMNNSQPQDDIIHSTPMVTTAPTTRTQQIVNKCEIVYVDQQASMP